MQSTLMLITWDLMLLGGVYPRDGGRRYQNFETQQTHPVSEDGPLPSAQGHYIQPLQ